MEIRKERLALLCEGGKEAVIQCASAFRFGGNWGWVLKDSQYTSTLNLLKGVKEHIKLLHVNNGTVILADKDFLAYNVNKVVPNALGERFLDLMVRTANTERYNFVKYLESCLKGRKNGIILKGSSAYVTFAIFSTNATNSIKMRGNRYKAFKLGYSAVLDILTQFSQSLGEGVQGYRYSKIELQCELEDGQKKWVPPCDIVGSSKLLVAFFRSLEIASTSTGVFMTMRLSK